MKGYPRGRERGRRRGGDITIRHCSMERAARCGQDGVSVSPGRGRGAVATLRCHGIFGKIVGEHVVDGWHVDILYSGGLLLRGLVRRVFAR